MNKIKKINPWAWIPTLYFAEGLPYVAVMTISVIMYKRLGISNTDIALYTGWLYLPWVVKPFWSPFVDLIKTKRWWVVTMQWILALAFAGIAFAVPTPFFFQLTLAVFWIVGFTSATHDIAADGFYMHGLDEHEQSLYVGIRSTFYRVATVVGQGLLVIIAGVIEMHSGLQPVRLKIDASPQYSNEIALSSADLSGKKAEGDEATFFFDQPEIKAGTMLAGGYSAQTVDSVVRKVYETNVRNGFVSAVETTQTKDAHVETAKKESAFTAFIRALFGEKREARTVTDNVVVSAIHLDRQPQPGEKIILNVNFKSGDQSISIENKALSTRFEFTEKNWDKPAYVLFHVDHKLKKPTTATFEGTSGNIPFAWMVVFLVLSGFFLLASVYHGRVLPRPVSDHPMPHVTANNIFKEFIKTFKTFFQRPQIGVAIAFMLLYRLPEAQLVKLINPFLLDSLDKGGLGLSTGEVGLVYGTVGIIGLTIGGIIGGVVAAKGGLKKWIWPMAWSMSLTCLTFVYLAYTQDQSLLNINICVFLEQFGYGFGFTAYMLYMIYFSEGESKTSHYAICTGFMALGMMLPGMMSGWLQETIGYKHFFIWTVICCVATVGVCAFIRVDPEFGKKKVGGN